MQLLHTMIRVKDLDETLAFYTDFIGLKEVRRKPIGDEATLVFLADEADRYRIELTYKVWGGVSEAAFKQAIELSHEKYCTVSNTLKGRADISYSYEINPDVP